MSLNIGFIGGGNMAGSLIGGIIANGYEAGHILVSDPNKDTRQHLERLFGIQTTGNNRKVVESMDVVVLAVKPQILQAVCRDLAASVQQCQPLIISIVAGIGSPDIERWLGGKCAIVRCMPNTPALLRCGATGMYAAPGVSAEQHEVAENILKAVGITMWLEEEALLDAVTAISGSGPAYFFLFMEAIQQAGQNLGLDAHQARELTLQTALGAARMAMESEDDPATLRAKVTSRGGTTEQAIQTFEQGGLRHLVEQALNAAQQRAHQLADIPGKDQ